MSNLQNDQWLESAQERFDEALANGDYPLAKDIISDVQEVNLEAGRSMNEQLRNTPVSQFGIKSPYPNI